MSLRVVITHDFMECYGGAERVAQEMATAFPDAPVVSLLGREEVAQRMGVADRFTSLLPAREGLLKNYRLLAPAFPALVDRMRIPEADVVLSSTYAFAHRLRPRNDHLRIAYCHSPLRFAWSQTESYRDRWAGGGVKARAFEALAAGMRRSDRRSAQDVDVYLTQSGYTADQIRRFYGREPEIVGVPVDCDRFLPSLGAADDYYLVAGRLIEPYKRMSVVIEAFRRMPHLKLVVAGDGPAGAELRRLAPPNVTFTGHLDDGELVSVLQRCRAMIFPSCDDFGLAPLEAMACGRPVLAYGAGGALNTVKPGMTGELFHEQTSDAVEAAVRAFDPGQYSPVMIRAFAEQWDSAAFRQRLRDVVARLAGVEESELAPMPAPTALDVPRLPSFRTERITRTLEDEEQERAWAQALGA